MCSAILFGAKAVLPTRADTAAEDAGTATDNITFSLLDMLPDIERMYRESFTLPFIKAEAKIYDPDIKEFYRELLDNTVLYDPEAQ